MCRARSLRFVTLLADNATGKQCWRSFLSLRPSRRNVSSSNTNAQTALVSLSPGSGKNLEIHSRHSQWSRPTAFSGVGNIPHIVPHTREAPLFGIAKDRSPAGRTRRNETTREDPVIRHDAVFLKKCSNAGSLADLKSRKYKQTWKEFSQKRVRPATEWGYFGEPHKK